MYKQVLDPVSHSLGLTSIFAILPLLTLFVLLGVVRLKAQWASLFALAVALLVAIIVYSMPVGQAADSALEGRHSASGRSCGSSSTPCGSTT